MKLYLNALAAGTLLGIVSGAAKLPGHTAAGIVLSILSLGLVKYGRTGITALAVMALELVPAHPIFHACLAPMLLALIVFLRTGPQSGAPRRKTVWWLAAIAPFTVLAQIGLGAAYRHKAWTVMPHMAGAAIAVSCTLVLSVLCIQNGASGENCDLRRPSIVLLIIVLSQAALGIAAFILRLLDSDSTVWFTVLSTGHVTVAAMLLASTASLWRLVVGNPSPHR